MKMMKFLPAAALGSLLLLTGCSSGVKTSCSTDMMGMTMSLEFGAKSENDPVDNLQVKIEIPTSLLSMAGVGDTEEDVRTYVEENMGSEVDQSTINVQMKDDKAIVTATATDDILGSADTPTFKEAKDMLKEQGVFACN